MGGVGEGGGGEGREGGVDIGYKFLSMQVYVNDHPQYVKVVDPSGVVQHHPWARNYNRMKESAGILSGGSVCL